MAAIAMRGLARRFIPEMLRLGMTATAGLNLLRSEGMGYRRTDFLSDFREFAGTERKRDPLRAIPKKYRPTEATIQRTEFRQISKFNYNYKLTGYDPVLDQEVEELLTVASDDILTMEEADEAVEQLAEEYKADIDIAQLIIEGVTVRA